MEPSAGERQRAGCQHDKGGLRGSCHVYNLALISKPACAVWQVTIDRLVCFYPCGGFICYAGLPIRRCQTPTAWAHGDHACLPIAMQDAGLGLWVLDGLLNVNIGPDGSDYAKTQLAAQSVPTAGPAPAPEVKSVVVDETSAERKGGPTQVVVDESSISYPTYTSGSGAVINPAEEQNPPYPTNAYEEQNPPYPTYRSGGAVPEKATYPTYTSGGAADAVNPVPSDTGSTVSAVATPAAYSGHATSGVETTLPAYDFSGGLDYDPSEVPTYTSQSGPNNSPSYVVPRPAKQAEDDAVWSTASQFSDTARMGARLSAPITSGGVPVATVTAVQPGAVVPPVASTAAPRRACDGGEQVWVSGSKYKCRYKRAQPVQVAPGQNTYANGVAVR